MAHRRVGKGCRYRLTGGCLEDAANEVFGGRMVQSGPVLGSDWEDLVILVDFGGGGGWLLRRHEGEKQE